MANPYEFESKYDRYVRSFKNDSGFPYYSIQKIGTHYHIRLAVAGYKKENIKINYSDNILTIRGSLGTTSAEESYSYLYQGISNRSFSRMFSVANYDSLETTLEDGILNILIGYLPDRGVVEIPVGGAGNKAQLLTESENKS